LEKTFFCWKYPSNTQKHILSIIDALNTLIHVTDASLVPPPCPVAMLVLWYREVYLIVIYFVISLLNKEKLAIKIFNDIYKLEHLIEQANFSN
jgi:hypothetical protein